jgi:hypothetical protein
MPLPQFLPFQSGWNQIESLFHSISIAIKLFTKSYQYINYYYYYSLYGFLAFTTIT